MSVAADPPSASPPAHPDRGRAMARSLAAAARAAGLPDDGVELLSRAHALAMEPRTEALDDDHHPAYLHPGRTALVLLRDAEVRDARVLAAATLVESRDGALRVEEARVRARLGEGMADLVAAVPAPGSEGLAEALVTAPEEVRLVALAEHLDHLRHLHVRGRAPDWEERAAEVEAVWLPMAGRTHERLAGRYRHWLRVFRRRLA